MDKNEIKKLLYKQNPMAKLDYIRKGNAYYSTKVDEVTINFEVPVEDMGTTDFFPEIEAKYLNRWILVEA